MPYSLTSPGLRRGAPSGLRVNGGWVSAALLAGLFVLTGCGQQSMEAQTTEPPTVGVIEVTLQKVNPFFEFVAKTRAKESVALRARVTGFLESREFREGGDVDVGQVELMGPNN
jgi:membrane fusion protein (multidrug efflux system)